MKTEIKGLIQKLNAYCTRSLEASAGLCVNRSHYEISVDHLLLQCLDNSQSDIPLLLKHFEIDPASWAKGIQQEIETFKNGNPSKPVFSASLLNLFENAWVGASLELNLSQIRSGILLAEMVDNPLRYGTNYLEGIERLNAADVLKQFDDLVQVSEEDARPIGMAVSAPGDPASAGPKGGSALEKFTTNFTENARQGKIDPVFGRDREIRQMIDILGRRRKNNPIAVGEAGVGKTAVVEGLALKVAEGDVPELIKDVEIVGLDLGLLQAGASVKGEFENRLNAVINEIKSSETPIILFIDEAHTLIGAGGAAGTGDAANLLKPALARGELRTVAATTWSEYKKYFEKDPALARRFQLVKLDEPSADDAIVILRGIREVYEKAHSVYVRDEAIVAAARLSARYITGRQLPDKAVDVLDTACARVKISLTTKPAVIDDLERRIAMLEREQKAISRDVDSGRSKDTERLNEVSAAIDQSKTEHASYVETWEKEQASVDKLIELRSTVDEAEKNEEKDKLKTLKPQLVDAISALEALQGDQGFVSYEVTADVVGKVISDWTGVPLGNIVKDEAAALLKFNQDMKSWIKGQDHAVDVIDDGIRTAKAGLNNPDQPLGIFLFVGPSGTGKTETALGVANLLYGGDRFMTTINMSEYQEKHTVSRLVGSPAGYVGYGEGGVLSEAVRQRPYSVVLLDEVEKADLEVMNLFYQVFDKGSLSDGEGRQIDFKNTIIFLTSNLASDIIMEMCSEDVMPPIEEVTEAIRPALQAHFKPALLARMKIVPYYPIKGEVLAGIVRIKLAKVGKRLKQNQKLDFVYDDAVIETVTRRCTDVESGARNIDHIVNGSLLPQMSTEVLQNIGEDSEYSKLCLSVAEDGSFVTTFA